LLKNIEGRDKWSSIWVGYAIDFHIVDANFISM